MCQTLHTKMTAWSFTTGEVVHFIMDTPGDGNESDEEKRAEDAKVDPDDDMMTVIVTLAIHK